MRGGAGPERMVGAACAGLLCARRRACGLRLRAQDLREGRGILVGHRPRNLAAVPRHGAPREPGHAAHGPHVGHALLLHHRGPGAGGRPPKDAFLRALRRRGAGHPDQGSRGIPGLGGRDVPLASHLRPMGRAAAAVPAERHRPLSRHRRALAPAGGLQESRVGPFLFHLRALGAVHLVEGPRPVPALLVFRTHRDPWAVSMDGIPRVVPEGRACRRLGAAKGERRGMVFRHLGRVHPFVFQRLPVQADQLHPAAFPPARPAGRQVARGRHAPARCVRQDADRAPGVRLPVRAHRGGPVRRR
jgi:hypothetical protein